MANINETGGKEGAKCKGKRPEMSFNLSAFAYQTPIDNGNPGTGDSRNSAKVCLISIMTSTQLINTLKQYIMTEINAFEALSPNKGPGLNFKRKVWTVGRMPVPGYQQRDRTARLL